MQSLKELQNGKRDKRDHWNAIPGLFNFYGISFETLRAHDFVGVKDAGLTPKRIGDMATLSGDIGLAGRKMMDYLRDATLYLMYYDDEQWKVKTGKTRWQTPILPSAANSRVPVVPENYYLKEVREYFAELLPHLGFWDREEAARRLREKFPHHWEGRLQRVESDYVRTEAVAAMKAWVEKRLAHRDDPADVIEDEKTNHTIASLREMKLPDIRKLIKNRGINAEKCGLKHGIDTTAIQRLTKEDLVTICAEHFGLIGDIVPAKRG